MRWFLARRLRLFAPYQTFLACARQLLGDFAWYEDQTDSDMTIGPFFFLLFVCIAVLVVLNVLIAIVCDAYSDAKQVQEELKNEPVNFTRELTTFLCAVIKKPSRWFDEEWLNCEEGNPLSERRQSSRRPSEHGEDRRRYQLRSLKVQLLLNMVITMQATMADDERIAFSDALVDRQVTVAHWVRSVPVLAERPQLHQVLHKRPHQMLTTLMLPKARRPHTLACPT